MIKAAAMLMAVFSDKGHGVTSVEIRPRLELALGRQLNFRREGHSTRAEVKRLLESINTEVAIGMLVCKRFEGRADDRT